MRKKLNKIKKNVWCMRIVLFLLISFSVLLFISFNSVYLINKLLRYIILFLMVVFIFYLYCFFKKANFNKLNKWFISLFVVYIIACTGFLILLYGPDKGFKDWLITTAMNTMSHQYYCKWFYSKEDIEKVMSNNYIIQPKDDTDSSLVDLSTSEEKIDYENEYEEAILDRIDGSLYKLIEFKVNGQDAYLAAIYDPAKVRVGVTKFLHKTGQYVTTMAKNNNAPIAINGGLFYDPNYNSTGGTPNGITYSDGKLITGTTSTITQLIGFNENNVLMLVNNCTIAKAEELKIRDAVHSTPFLIVNGKPAFISGNGGWGYAARTAIGQRADGIVLFLVVDTNEFRSAGADMRDLTEIMMNYGAVNAANLDGGTSSVMAINHKLINDPINSALQHKTRGVPTMFYAR